MDKGFRLRPLRFRFTDDDDAAKYGNPDSDGGWWIYDESQITALPVGDLIEIERQTQPITMLQAMQGMRDENVLGYHIGSWVAIRTANPEIAGDYRSYNPKAILILWERVPDDDEPAEAADPLDLKSSANSSPAASSTPSTASKPRSRSSRTPRPKR